MIPIVAAFPPDNEGRPTPECDIDPVGVKGRGHHIGRAHEKWAPCLSPITTQLFGPLVCLIRPPPPPPPPPQKASLPSRSPATDEKNQTDGLFLDSPPPISAPSNPPPSYPDTNPTSNPAPTPPSPPTTATLAEPRSHISSRVVHRPGGRFIRGSLGRTVPSRSRPRRTRPQRVFKQVGDVSWVYREPGDWGEDLGVVVGRCDLSKPSLRTTLLEAGGMDNWIGHMVALARS